MVARPLRGRGVNGSVHVLLRLVCFIDNGQKILAVPPHQPLPIATKTSLSAGQVRERTLRMRSESFRSALLLASLVMSSCFYQAQRRRDQKMTLCFCVSAMSPPTQLNLSTFSTAVPWRRVACRVFLIRCYMPVSPLGYGSLRTVEC